MARVLDFNKVQSSFLDITLRDKNRTVVHLDLPMEALVNELENMQGELDKMKSGNKEGVDAIYDLGARLMNCNFDYFTTTGEELRTKYGMNLVLMMAFFTTYMGGIKELSGAKN